jgi:hypothetical protein
LINEHTHPLLAQHVINGRFISAYTCHNIDCFSGEPILPATGFIEIVRI